MSQELTIEAALQGLDKDCLPDCTECRRAPISNATYCADCGKIYSVNHCIAAGTLHSNNRVSQKKSAAFKTIGRCKKCQEELESSIAR